MINYMKENWVKNNQGIVIAVFTLLMTLSQYWNNSLYQSVVEKQSMYNSQLLEFYASINYFEQNQANSNLQSSNWFNCLNLKDTVYCSTILELMKFENENKDSSFTRIKRKGEEYNFAVGEYELAKKRQKSYSFYLDIMFYSSVFMIFTVTLTLKHKKKHFD